jgi:hypothetical protein
VLRLFLGQLHLAGTIRELGVAAHPARYQNRVAKAKQLDEGIVETFVLVDFFGE